MPATYNPVLQDLSYPYQLPASMLMAAHGYAVAALKRCYMTQDHVGAVCDNRTHPCTLCAKGKANAGHQ